jgi:hypothetical protein
MFSLLINRPVAELFILGVIAGYVASEVSGANAA